MYPSLPAVLEINGPHPSLFSAKVYLLPLTEKQVEQQNSKFNSIDMFEPGIKENR